MKCPNCGNDVDGTKNTCEKCGFSLYGPRNLSVNEVYQNDKKGSIENITGIDFNEIMKQNIPKEEPKKDFGSSLKSFFNKFLNFLKKFWTYIVIVLLIIIIIILIVCLFNKKDLECPSSNCPKIECNSNSKYVVNGVYYSYVPNGYRYYKNGNTFILSNDKTTIGVYPLVDAKLEFTTASYLAKDYKNQGFNDASVSESLLNNKKIFLIKYSSNNTYYCNFYYQYDTEKALYGLIYSSDSNVELYDLNIQKIISSITVDSNNYSGVFIPSSINYDSIFSRMN